MSDFEKLLRLLQKELTYQEKILSLLTKERTAIVKLNQEQLEEFRGQKEKLVGEAMALDQQRLAVMNRIFNSDAQEEQPKFAEIVSQCREPSVRNELSKIGDELRNVVGTVKQLNDENSDLIKHSLGLIATTMAIMRSQPGTELPTYKPSGKLTSKEDDPAFSGRRSGLNSAA